jgi:hypothetical protein
MDDITQELTIMNFACLTAQNQQKQNPVRDDRFIETI